MGLIKKRAPPPKRRVWRISQAAPLGEYIDPDLPPVPVARTVESRTGWTLSTLDLLHGVDVDETAETVPVELFDELFQKRP